MIKVRGNSTLRSLDKVIGIPALSALGVFKTRRVLPKTIRSIGLLRTACLGDTLLLSALIQDLRQSLPETRIVVFAAKENYEIATMLAHGIEVQRIDVTRPHQSAAIMRREKLDVLIDFGQWPRIDALLTVLARARYSIGFATEGQHRHRAFDLAVPHSRDLHEMENFRNLVRPLGIEISHLPSIDVGDSELPGPALPQPYVVCHAAAGGFKSWVRQWPNEYWGQLVQRLNADGVTVLFSGAPSDRELNKEIIEALPVGASARNAAGEYTLQQSVRLLREAAAVVSVNTGTMHLAAAAGGAVIGLNGPTSTTRWGVLGERSLSLEPDVAGCGYLYLGSEYAGQRLDCMQHISVDKVYAAVRAKLDERA